MIIDSNSPFTRGAFLGVIKKLTANTVLLCCLFTSLGMSAASQPPSSGLLGFVGAHARTDELRHHFGGRCCVAQKQRGEGVALLSQPSSSLSPLHPLVAARFHGLPALLLGAALFLCSPLPAASAGAELPLVSSAQTVLHEPAHEVEAFDEDLAILARRMLDTMYAEGGIGLAAPQIGIDQRIFVYNIFGQPLRLAATEHVLVNPRVLRLSEWSWTSPEGCLSLPDARGLVTRPIRVELEACDVEGHTITQTFTGVEARVVMHELDHLDGVLFTESGWKWQNLIGSTTCYTLLLAGSAWLAKAADSVEDRL
mmetsp:Transcript_46011/g.67513  ORF Transcript_46011/g.67513 Transcript_46011/m.67513 type:complete len:311 (-) Transcript_46011:260-1192(-)|eukprot:CAMPEP_0173073158 /NCGR_PEP_ID=MMETSP1102-20130122/10235_1 /TAXON_ID=49646 /ORGANISM="Geminigera sp., Strain Caron Lab Isolate" /LENGTH=310 /DNA_ID=CAMNT_0013941943 /DNA_START=202 /DNA_END=1134 /DNA_ORIENTATION=+